jgi:beta-phosphoglucomutase-like phosphatase (HAD superfamily)
MRIFVDLDGVLIDSTIPMMNTWLRDHHAIGENGYPVECGWDIVGATNTVLRRYGYEGGELTPAEFWAPFDHKFWASRKPYPGAKAFVAALEEFGDVYFASSPTLAPGSSSGKHACIAEHFPDQLRRLIIGACKSLLAHPSGSVLIDDADMNCINFDAEGGKTILVPRPWNPRSGETIHNTYTLILDELETLCNL